VGESSGGILLKPVAESSFVERDGTLVHTGKPIRPFCWDEITEDLDREMVLAHFAR
jgi:hypothetical protein